MNTCWLSKLSLDGTLRFMQGALSIAVWRQRIPNLLFRSTTAETAVTEVLRLFEMQHLAKVVKYLVG